jgi:hypothetical protein
VVVVVATVSAVATWRGFAGEAAPRAPGASGVPASGAAASGAPATAAASRLPAPTNFAYCEGGPDSRVLCPTAPLCYDRDDSETPCAGKHATELFAAGLLPPDGSEMGSVAVAKRPEVKETCGDKVMTSRSIDQNRTRDWARYSQWIQVNGQDRFYCKAGPRDDAETTGSVFRTARA